MDKYDENLIVFAAVCIFIICMFAGFRLSMLEEENKQLKQEIVELKTQNLIIKNF